MTRASMILCALAAALAGSSCSDDGTANASGGGTGDDDGNGTAAGDGTAPGDGTAAGDDGADGGTAGGDGGPGGSAGDDGGSGPSDDTGELPGVACLDEQFIIGLSPGPNYNEFDVPLGSHCQGTNQQDITDVERVVFIGDSVTVGTPPTGAADFYRSILAAELATMFGLQPPEAGWNTANPLTGTSGVQESGDFANCSVWGARNDDLMAQLEDCFAAEDFAERTLIITTMGGNDASAIAQDALDGAPINVLFEELEEMVANHEAAVQWITEEGRFPNGVFVVNANVFEYTDYTLDFPSCAAAGTVGLDGVPKNPELLLSSLDLINSEYMRIAQENGTDVVFMFEAFCGHGYHAGDPSSPCFRGPDNANWFDISCIHPTPTGHAALAEMFVNVVSE
jgi:lysophospholipase L1-like esterase